MKTFRRFARKGRTRGRGWGDLTSDDPRLDFLPIVSGNRPTGVFCPLPLYCLVPVALVAAAEARHLLCDPAGICYHARFGTPGNRGLAPLPARIDAERRRYSVP